MIICNTRSDFTKKRSQIDYNKKIGLVPTMGNLHAGHLSLVNQCLADSDVTIVTIFVNPLQFAPNEDFDKYPRTYEQDLKLLKQLESNYSDKEILVYAPSSAEEIFETGYQTHISITGLNSISEGKDRPSHFDGVTTVVYRLFQLAKPQIAYFGKKDFQQQLLIKKMVKDLMIPVIIKSLPTVREESGLALSSRNNYLSGDEKKDALHLYSALEHLKVVVKNQFSNFGKLLPEQIQEECSIIQKQNQNFTYLEVRDTNNFEFINENSLSVVIVGAYRVGNIRILDNLEIHLGANIGS